MPSTLGDASKRDGSATEGSVYQDKPVLHLPRLNLQFVGDTENVLD
jgi:hypothetical protein